MIFYLGIDEVSDHNLILEILNKRRFEAALEVPDEGCPRGLAWDTDLAEAAQVWADQCAMVEYKDPLASMILSYRL